MNKKFDEAAYKARQRSRARAMAIALGAMVMLFYAVSIAKMVVTQ